MSTNGTVLLPRLYQLPHVVSPNASSPPCGSPRSLLSGAVEAAPTYCRSPPLAVSLIVQPSVNLPLQAGSRGDDACSSSTLISDWYRWLPLPWSTPLPLRLSTA